MKESLQKREFLFLKSIKFRAKTAQHEQIYNIGGQHKFYEPSKQDEGNLWELNVFYFKTMSDNLRPMINLQSNFLVAYSWSHCMKGCASS